GVNLKRSRHLLPVLPCALVFVGLAYHRILEQHRWGLVLGVVVMVGGSITHLVQASQQFVDKQNRLDQRPELMAGRWLAETFPDSTSMLFDMYAYVPSQFQNTFRLIGQSYVLVNHFEPDLLLIRDATAHDYSNRAEAPRARMGEQSFLDRHFFYRYLTEGHIPTYRLLRQFDRISIYERTVPRVRTEGTPKERWWHLVKSHLNKRHYGVVSARWTIGYLHTIWGDEEDAKREFRLAREASNFAMRVYKHGIRALEIGRVDEAKSAYAAALQSTQGQSAGYRSEMRENLSFQYLKAGLFAEAAAEADTALSLNLALLKAAFQKAGAELSLGGGNRGKLLFDQAVARFGPQDAGETVLRILVDRQVGAAQDLLDQYYPETTP
ncbi:MAG: hypothetical protein O7G87_22245, partial [bacterium]|nr:hypothetical protein [bacterium]